MAKIKKDKEHDYYLFIKCPACGEEHALPIGAERDGKKIWTFDGNLESPTISPSFRLSIPAHDGIPFWQCHFNITNGTIILHGDSTHGKTGTFPLEEYGNE